MKMLPVIGLVAGIAFGSGAALANETVRLNVAPACAAGIELPTDDRLCLYIGFALVQDVEIEMVADGEGELKGSISEECSQSTSSGATAKATLTIAADRSSVDNPLSLGFRVKDQDGKTVARTTFDFTKENELQFPDTSVRGVVGSGNCPPIAWIDVKPSQGQFAEAKKISFRKVIPKSEL